MKTLVSVVVLFFSFVCVGQAQESFTAFGSTVNYALPNPDQWNLVKNGIESATGGGQTARITITTRYRAGFRFGGSRSNRSRGALEIAIADNGPGVPDAQSASVFEPFYTTKSGGAGIGLAVVSEIMNAHTGFTLLDSGPGGACFRLLFPINRRKGTKSK